MCTSFTYPDTTLVTRKRNTNRKPRTLVACAFILVTNGHLSLKSGPQSRNPVIHRRGISSKSPFLTQRCWTRPANCGLDECHTRRGGREIEGRHSRLGGFLSTWVDVSMHRSRRTLPVYPVPLCRRGVSRASDTVPSEFVLGSTPSPFNSVGNRGLECEGFVAPHEVKCKAPVSSPVRFV